MGAGRKIYAFGAERHTRVRLFAVGSSRVAGGPLPTRVGTRARVTVGVRLA